MLARPGWSGYLRHDFIQRIIFPLQPRPILLHADLKDPDQIQPVPQIGRSKQLGAHLLGHLFAHPQFLALGEHPSRDGKDVSLFDGDVPLIDNVQPLQQVPEAPALGLGEGPGGQPAAAQLIDLLVLHLDAGMLRRQSAQRSVDCVRVRIAASSSAP